METIPHLSIGAAALIIFAVCAAYVLLRGIFRMAIGTAVLAASAWLAFLTWQNAPSLSIDWFGSSVGFITTDLPIIVFIVSFLAIRIILRFIARPFGPSASESPSGRFSWFRLVTLGLIALIPTAILFCIMIGFIHHTGSIHELRSYALKRSNSPAGTTTPEDWLATLKTSVDRTLPESWLNAIDPMAQKSRLTLAKIAAMQSRPEPMTVLDPSTGKPITRAVLVEYPEIRKLAQEENFGTLLRHPLITKALQDPEIQRLIKELKL